MEHLTALDAGFLGAEDSDHNVSMAIGALAVLEGPIPDHASVQATLAERVRVCPRFAQRLVRHPFDLGAPEWVDDPGFDIAQHVGRIAVPAPGGEAELYGVVADVMSWRLDRNRPLWEIWVIGGLSDGRWALLMKVHHCIADGIATAHMLTGLSDNGFDHSAMRVAAHPHGAAQPLHERTVPDFNPLHWMRELRGAVEIATGLLHPTTSALNGPITSRRRYSAARVSLADVRQVCQVFGVTINDVALAALTESYRDFMIRRGEQPQPDSLRTLVPVSTRSADALEATDNRVSLMLPRLPVEEDNPVQRLLTIRSRLSHTKSSGQRQAGSAVVSAAALMPFALSAWALRLLTRLPQRSVAALATNVPGPEKPLEIMGCNVVQVLPVPPIAMQLRTGVAILSYAEDLFIGILADFEIAGVDELARGVEVAVARLVARSRRPAPLRDRHGMTLVHSA